MYQINDSYRILIIEDNLGDFVLAEDMLLEQTPKSKIASAKSYSEAENLILKGGIEFDVIFLDLSLPDLQGDELILSVIKLVPDTPVIALTGNSELSYAVRSLTLGAADYLMKDSLTSIVLFKSIVYTTENFRYTRALEESEKKYSNLFHLSPQPMWVYYPDSLQFVQVNKAATDIFGYSEEEFLNLTVYDLFNSNELPKLKKSKARRDERKLVINKGQFTLITKSGEKRAVEIISGPIVIKNKKMRIAIANDITEVLQYEMKLNQAIVVTQEKERLFLGTELHDNINQLLAASKLNLQMIEDKLSDESLHFLNTSSELVDKAIFEVRKLSHQLAPVFNEFIDFEDTVTDLINEMNLKHSYSVDIKCKEEAKDVYLSPELQLALYRIIQEHISNIIKHAEAKAINISFRKNDLYQIKISDDGVGFDQEAVKSGGIGLINMQRRLEPFNGALEIKSSPGNGTSISIKVPVIESALSNLD